MADVTFLALVQQQIRLLQHICETLTTRALAGKRADLDSLFLAQEHLEHWGQYLSPLALEAAERPFDAPPPLPSMRPAPPLAHEPVGVEDGLEPDLRPRVTFPPEPLWVDDLERDQGEREP